MKKKRTIQAGLMALLSMVLMLTGCKQTQQPSAAESPTPEATAEPTAETASNDEIIILFTSDIHCGVKSGFGMVGLAQIKEMFKQNGYNVLLVDDGDAIQGDALGTLTKGQAIIDLMNAIHYDVAIPGNHEFDYGMDEFFALTKKAEFPYISCNFNKQGELLLEPYVIKEAAGKKIGFI
ncbi:MAG: bifunctional metallophosphatase/5'-nucleotidase, partial [Solobacterium sp.]|nr:bifunctional metallophosphatase/5'-nucleotidase [Solobacterium sp.]